MRPFVAAAEVKLCPDPTAFTFWPCSDALATRAANSATDLGASMDTGLAF